MLMMIGVDAAQLELAEQLERGRGRSSAKSHPVPPPTIDTCTLWHQLDWWNQCLAALLASKRKST